MSVKTGRKQVKRDSRGRFVKGTSPNPSGRPKGSKNFTTIVREAFEKLDAKGLDPREELAKVVIAKALEGDHKMIKLLWERMDGPVVAATEKSEAEAFNITINGAKQEVLDKIYNN